MNIDEVDFYQSPWLSPADLKGKPARVHISEVRLETVRNSKGGHDEKLAVSFTGAKKRLLLNKTNARALAAVLGKNTDGWIGKAVQLTPATAPNGKDTIKVTVG